MITVAPIMRAAPGWSPSPFQAPSIRPRLAQTVITSPVTPPGSTPPGMQRPPLIDSALVNMILDALGATACGILSYGSSISGSHTWSKVYGVMATALAIRGFYNLTNVRER